MGTRGVIPKPIEERLGVVSSSRKRDDSLAKQPPPEKAAKMPKHLEKKMFCASAWNWLKALRAGVPGKYMQDRDWAWAEHVADVWTKQHQSSKLNAGIEAFLHKATADFLTTEGARRRVRMELTPVDDDVTPEAAEDKVTRSRYKDELAKRRSK